MTPKQRQFSIIAPNPHQTIARHEQWEGFPLLLCHLLSYHPAWLVSETETTKSKQGDTTQTPEVCQNRFYFVIETLDFCEKQKQDLRIVLHDVELL